MATQDTMQHDSKQGSGGQDHAGRMYLLFAAMIATSTVVMFLLTYTNAYTWSHMTFSQERLYMAILMGSAMALVMLALLAVFATGAVWFGVQAKRLGRRAGLVPAILAGLGVVYFLVGGLVMLVQWLT